jgi:ribosome recycling factor
VAVQGRDLVVTPFDATQLASLRKALERSSLGFAVRDDGRVLRLAAPPPSEERRAEIAREVGRVLETARQALRSARADGERALKTAEKAGELNPRHAAGRIKTLRAEFEAAIEELNRLPRP